MANDNAIPENADKIVFAFDVFNYIMRQQDSEMRRVLSDSSFGRTVEKYRLHTQTVFSNQLEKLCDGILRSNANIHEEFKKLMEKNKVSSHCLYEYNRECRKSCLVEGSDATNFFTYCTRISQMACYFFSHGLTEAAEIAVDLIVSAIPDDPNLNWTNFDFGIEIRMHTDESSDAMNEYFLGQETANILSSETEEISNDSIKNSESDSVVTNKFHQCETSSETESTSEITHEEVSELTAGIGELSVSNFDHTCDVMEHSGISSLTPSAVSGSNLTPSAVSGSNLTPSAVSGSNLSPSAVSGSSLSVPVTRSSSVSPRRRPFLKEDKTHLQPRNLSDELAKPTSILGKRRSTGKDDSVSSDIPESAAEKDETAEDVFAPSEIKKPKIEDNDEK